MRNVLLLFVSSLFLAATAHAALEAGEKAPAFSAKASLNGEEYEYSLAEALENGAVVVYFYPSAYTNGCNIQAHQFSVNMDAFEASGASVIGVSLDSIERLNDFSADPDYCAGRLSVASDVSGAIAKSYGLNVRDAVEGRTDTRGETLDHGFAERVTFIVGRDGQINETIGGVAPFDNVKESLAAVQRLQDGS